MAEEKNKGDLTQLVKEEIRVADELDILRIISPMSFYHLVRRDLYLREVYRAHEKEVGGGIKW